MLAGDGDELRCEVDLRRLVVEMLLGVAHVHSVHVVHRDIKPENFLLGGDGGRRVKLCDFGLAAELPPGGLLSGVFGTSPYMSPEMAAGRGHGLATDLWSYGVCVHLTLHGELPVWPGGCEEADSAAAQAAIWRGSQPIDFEPLVLGNGTPPGACAGGGGSAALLRRLLAREPSRRPSAAEALEMPYLHVSDSSGPSASPSSPPPRPHWPVTVACHDLAPAGADKDMGLSDTGSTATPPGSL